VTAAATEHPPVDLLALTARLVDVRSESHAEQELTDLIEAELSRHAPWLALDRVGCNLVARTTLGRGQRLVVAGHTSSDFPITNAVQRTFAGGATDAFVTKIGPASPYFSVSTANRSAPLAVESKVRPFVGEKNSLRMEK
jgi:hypothetical protein